MRNKAYIHGPRGQTRPDRKERVILTQDKQGIFKVRNTERINAEGGSELPIR